MSRATGLKSFIIPAAFTTYGILSFPVHKIREIDFDIQSTISDGHPLLINHADDVLQYTPAILAYALPLAGINGKHSFWGKTQRYFLAEGMMASSVLLLKHAVSRRGADGKINHSFPSGHTGTAFTAAGFLSHEYGDVSPWFSAGAYTIAAVTGMLRVYNNYHVLSDVLTGAGIGIASAKLAYLVYPLLEKKTASATKSWLLLPSYQSKGLYVSFMKEL